MASKAILILILFFAFLQDTEPKMYTKDYHSNGTLKAEGWVLGEQKTNFWKFYHDNGRIAAQGHYKKNLRTDYWHFYNPQGTLLKEGHYEQGIARNWWIFYDLARQESRKIQYDDDQRNGFCLIYKSNKLITTEKYKNDHLIGSCSNLREFRKANPEVSLLSL